MKEPAEERLERRPRIRGSRPDRRSRGGGRRGSHDIVVQVALEPREPWEQRLGRGGRERRLGPSRLAPEPGGDGV